MKLLYNLAKNNDYNTFKDALMDEVGYKAFRKLNTIIDLALFKTKPPVNLDVEQSMIEEGKRLVQKASHRFGLDPETLTGKSNKREYVYVRTAIMVVLFERFPIVRFYIMAGKVFKRPHMFLYNCQQRHDKIKNYDDYAGIYSIVKDL